MSKRNIFDVLSEQHIDLKQVARCVKALRVISVLKLKTNKAREDALVTMSLYDSSIGNRGFLEVLYHPATDIYKGDELDMAHLMVDASAFDLPEWWLR